MMSPETDNPDVCHVQAILKQIAEVGEPPKVGCHNFPSYMERVLRNARLACRAVVADVLNVVNADNCYAFSRSDDTPSNNYDVYDSHDIVSGNKYKWINLQPGFNMTLQTFIRRQFVKPVGALRFRLTDQA